jgi:hypothetical protein
MKTRHVRGVGICVIAVALTQVGRASWLANPAAGGAPQLDVVKLFPGPAGNAEVSAWVVEPVPPAPRGPARFFRSSIRPSPSAANRNRNPLNIKLGSGTRRYLDINLAAISDVVPKDGGRFLKFDSPETGFMAAVELLRTPPYRALRLDRALRLWSNNGFGSEILAGTRLDAATPVPYLRRDDLGTLLYVMAAAEGYQSSTIADEIRTALRP